MGFQIDQVIKSLPAQQTQIVFYSMLTLFVSFHRQSTTSRDGQWFHRGRLKSRFRDFPAKLTGVLVPDPDVLTQIFPRTWSETASRAVRLLASRSLFLLRMADEEMVIAIAGPSEGAIAPLTSILQMTEFFNLDVTFGDDCNRRRRWEARGRCDSETIRWIIFLELVIQIEHYLKQTIYILICLIFISMLFKVVQV